MLNSIKAPKQFTSIGGQAVLEGVMMRSPHFISVAVRKADGKIIVRNKPFKSIAEKIPFVKKPLLRGVVLLVESMIQGMEALGFSAEHAAIEDQKGEPQKEKSEKLSSLAIAGSMITAFVLGMGLFVALPHLLTLLVERSTDSPVFHLVDGVFKMTILLLYVYLIGKMKDIHRVFQYHGAEHKTIYAFEFGEELTVENAKKQSTLHPRCGTSFLLFLVLISITVFSIVFPVLGISRFSETAWINHLIMIGIKILLMFPVAGLSYEFIKACACRMDSPFFRALIWPGMVLQNLTTREPDDDQLEVAIASMKQVLLLEKNPEARHSQAVEFELADIRQLATASASVAEFLE